MSLSGSLSTPGCLRDVADLRKLSQLPENLYSTLAISRLSQKEGNRKEWLIRPSQVWFTVRGKPGLVIEVKGN
jgi:hypothetical protein